MGTLKFIKKGLIRHFVLSSLFNLLRGMYYKIPRDVGFPMVIGQSDSPVAKATPWWPKQLPGGQSHSPVAKATPRWPKPLPGGQSDSPVAKATPRWPKRLLGGQSASPAAKVIPLWQKQLLLWQK